jgi:hypothetical protein
MLKLLEGHKGRQSNQMTQNEMQLMAEKHISDASAVEWIEGLVEYLEQQNYKLLSDKLVLHKRRAAKGRRHLKHKSTTDYC